MTDSPRGMGLSPRLILASYALNGAVFLGTWTAAGTLLWDDPLSGLLGVIFFDWPVVELSGIAGSVLRLSLLLFAGLGLSGFVKDQWKQ